MNSAFSLVVCAVVIAAALAPALYAASTVA